MKAFTALLIGAGMLVSSASVAQVNGQASISGYVLSYGSAGFRIQGPDGIYGIAVMPNTVFTDPANGAVSVGPQTAIPGSYVTATGYPASQWIMNATVVSVNNGYSSYYGGGYGTAVISGVGSPQVSGVLPSNFGSFKTSRVPFFNPFSAVTTTSSSPAPMVSSAFPSRFFGTNLPATQGTTINGRPIWNGNPIMQPRGMGAVAAGVHR